MKNKFIVIEGLEGAGKTTAHTVVVSVLQEYNINNIVLTREPGGTPLAERLRILIKQSVDGEKICDKAELLMIYAARIQLIENVIKPALARGAWVIGDRHDFSSQAYQAGGRGLDMQLINTLRHIILGDFSPDLTLYLDITPEISLHRIYQRGQLDRIEQESLNFFQRVREHYLKVSAVDSKVIIIDATQNLKTVKLSLQKVLYNWLENLNL
ncbi:dTMP kinase [Pantoea sp. Mhis]|uniref:dTMP kinase n=1 Tax=Pantoea sp. Mhis TaxID=2576759 RepID=UPI00135736FD|nr:dTMP kinase [Pantoea sp. Mhis]MXP56311.1 dTMP kinase [Pantoea sp. Mhis]